MQSNKPADDRQRQNHFAVFMRLVGSCQFICYGPDQVGLFVDVNIKCCCDYFTSYAKILFINQLASYNQLIIVNAIDM